MAVGTAPGIGHPRPAVYVVSVFSSLETRDSLKSAEPRLALTFGATAADCANGTASQDVCGIHRCLNDKPV